MYPKQFSVHKFTWEKMCRWAWWGMCVRWVWWGMCVRWAWWGMPIISAHEAEAGAFPGSKLAAWAT